MDAYVRAREGASPCMGELDGVVASARFLWFGSKKSDIFKKSKNFRKNIFCFVHKFFETKYFPLIFLLRKRSRSVDAENGQTLDLTPSEPGDILTQKPCYIYVTSRRERVKVL